ncbi:unnamed protein product [Lampetra fluviatilis]
MDVTGTSDEAVSVKLEEDGASCGMWPGLSMKDVRAWIRQNPYVKREGQPGCLDTQQQQHQQQQHQQQQHQQQQHQQQQHQQQQQQQLQVAPNEGHVEVAVCDRTSSQSLAEVEVELEASGEASDVQDSDVAGGGDLSGTPSGDVSVKRAGEALAVTMPGATLQPGSPTRLYVGLEWSCLQRGLSGVTHGSSRAAAGQQQGSSRAAAGQQASPPGLGLVASRGVLLVTPHHVGVEHLR